MGGGGSKDRYYILVNLAEIFTEETGHWFSEGEFFVSLTSGSGLFGKMHHRFPAHGLIRMNKREQFKPDPAPTLYADIRTAGKEPLKMRLIVKGKSAIVDDKFIDCEFVVAYNDADAVQEFKSKDGKVICKLRVKVNKNNAW